MIARRAGLWAAFAWIGIPILFVAWVSLTALPLRPEGVWLATTLTFVACGTWAIAKGQRPRRQWIVLLYPFPMFFLLMLIFSATMLFGSGGM